MGDKVHYPENIRGDGDCSIVFFLKAGFIMIGAIRPVHGSDCESKQ